MNIPNKPIFIIAEIAQAHDGSLGIAHSYIDALAETGVNAVKFQTHIAKAESSDFEPFRVNFSYEDATRFDYWKRMEFSLEQWKGLKQHCVKSGLEFMSSPFSVAAVDLLEQLEVKRYKVGSGEVSNLLLLNRIAKTGKPILLSSGLSSLLELRQAHDFLKPFGNELTMLQCTTAYPTQPKQWGINLIAELHNEFKLPVGFSDHSGDIFACLAAAAAGAQVLEFHVVFDKKMFGPDAKASLTIDQVKLLVQGVRQMEIALAHPLRKSESEDLSLKKMFGKSLAVNKDLKKGHLIALSDLESKKPEGHGVKAADFEQVLGKKLIKDLPAFAFLKKEDLE